MSITELLPSIGIDAHSVLSGGGIFIFAMLTILQVAPIKINPWSWLAKKIGHAFNHDLYEKILCIERNMADMKHQAEERDITDCRGRILQFGDELLHDEHHSKERFDQILLDISFYEHYCDTHHEYSNNVALLTIARIKEIYKKCMKERSFL